MGAVDEGKSMEKKVKVGRNAPCPCGSGKKYKNCCGFVENTIHTNEAIDAIHFNRQISYLGAIGKKREAFCLEYIAHKKQIFKLIAQKQRDVAVSQGSKIACHQGCSGCCDALIKCSLQEAEAIVYYIYQHEDVLNSFVKSFPGWLTETYKHSDVLKKTEEILSKPFDEQVVDALLSQDAGTNGAAYWGLLHIHCPFLVNNRCSIYEVRPFTCVNLASTGICGQEENAKPFCLELQPELEQPFWDSRIKCHFTGIMPSLVFKLLSGSFLALSQIAGLEKLLDEFYNDPLVRRFGANLIA